MRTIGNAGMALFVATTLFGGAHARADVRLPGFFGDHMVLQREMKLPVWGWADPGETVRVRLGTAAAATATADAAGRWRVTLPARKAGGPHTLVVQGKNTVTIRDVLIGEVWLCSGQSNMEWTVGRSNDAKNEIAGANWPKIRHIKIPKKPSTLPQDDVKGVWQVCSPKTAANFTAAGYFFARHLHKELQVPVGLINSSWGGTRVEPWTPPEGFAAVPALESIYKDVQLRLPGSPRYKSRMGKYLANTETWLAGAKQALANGRAVPPPPPHPDNASGKINHQSPTALYNGMIHPLVGYAMRGALWYQGESNHREGMLYYEKKKALIGGWRKLWGIGAFPFYYVQIAPYRYGNENPEILARFWEAQTKVLDVPNTGMVVTTDIGNVRNIHPRNKQEVGHRLALLAMARTYGKAGVVDTGPVFRSLSPKGDTLRVIFGSVAGGLKSRDGKPLTWFEIVGEDGAFHKAAAKIDGDSVILSSPKVPKPVAMRFAWHKNAEPNLVNGAGLPAWTFRAGDVPKRE